jgi:hypothetical protein
MIKIIFFLFLFSESCHQCDDKNFDAKFKYTINKLELLKSEGISFQNTIDSIKISSQILSSLTGIKPHISFDYTVTYLEKDFKNDSTKWYRWHEKNKCSVTVATFDSIASKVRSNYQR